MRKYLIAALALGVITATGSIPASAQRSDRFGRPAPYSSQRYMYGDPERGPSSQGEYFANPEPHTGTQYNNEEHGLGY
jgi:hypothetical protein